jgi:hypothetical protein
MIRVILDTRWWFYIPIIPLIFIMKVAEWTLDDDGYGRYIFIVSFFCFYQSLSVIFLILYLIKTFL